MKIYSAKNNISFSSYNNPIKSFDMKTPKGIVHFAEINYKHPPSNSFYNKLAHFILDNFANTSSHPFWASCRKPTLNKEIYDDYIRSNIHSYKTALNGKDTTILVGRDKSKNIVAALFSKPLRENSKLRDRDVLYIDSIAVDSGYRANGLGAAMLNKVTEASKNRFTDMFLVAYKEAVPFYKALNFKPLAWYSNPHQRYFIAEMAKERIDYPLYAEFFEKPLEKFDPIKWYKRVERRNIPR